MNIDSGAIYDGYISGNIIVSGATFSVSGGTGSWSPANFSGTTVSNFTSISGDATTNPYDHNFIISPSFTSGDATAHISMVQVTDSGSIARNGGSFNIDKQ
jgi:hypothetical protein